MTTDELSEHGMVQMDEESIRGFLLSQSVGVLGLPTDGAPALRPMSFWFDDNSRLYFFYLTGSSSRKVELTDQATVARFLVYRAETTFNWRSVLLAGSISNVPDDERTDLMEDAELSGRPDIFERASTAENTRFYRLEIEDQSGIKHLGLPPGVTNEEAAAGDTTE